ncbi:hypothetical protein AVEN_42344-1 [Araneus ventricosus]|uniref:Uncharacterized protein n=1 Tax=Araneus ventricosus TaxID=182803 RepID=A0A4Y2SKC1_ARAVE|nr:hypothetical protein AVEN_42344-1 [Araneus ventricosus]
MCKSAEGLEIREPSVLRESRFESAQGGVGAVTLGDRCARRLWICCSLRPTNWIREDVIFSQHGPFPAYLKRFHLSDSDYCSCGGIGTALFYTVSWHMRKPAPNFEQEWLKRVANNLVSGQKIRGIIKFMSENRDLIRPP